jgi:hypothetical protein
MMKLILAVLMLAVLAASGADYFGRCAVVHVEQDSLPTVYSFFAAVPAYYFQESGSSYGSLLVTDGADSKSGYYTLEDWASYLTSTGGSGSVTFVGDVDSAFKTTVQGMVPHSDEITYSGSPEEIACAIAKREWPSTPKAVLCIISDTDISYMNGAAAAAGWAANNNCPVLWTDGSALGSLTVEALTSMGVSQVFLFDYPAAVSGAVTDTLAAMSITVTPFDSAAVLLPATIALTNQAVACVYKEEMQSLPAALAAARYAGYALKLPAGIDGLAFAALLELKQIIPDSFYKLERPVTGVNSTGSAAIAAAFFTFLDGAGGSIDNKLEYVLTFSNQNVLPATFERSITGDPSEVTRAGAIPGRFPLEWVDNIGTINRGALYDAVIHANPRPDHVTIAMNAYEVQYWNKYTFSDNWYSNFVVNEMFGWPEEGWTAANNYFPGWPPSQPGLDPMWPATTDGADTGGCPGQYATFLGENYDSAFHSGAAAGTGTHPAQPNVPLCGFVQDVIDGSTFLYFSCHGGGTSISVREVDNGIAQDNYSIHFQDPWWPDSDGRVFDGSDGGSYTQTDLDSDFENMHSVIIAYNACDMANGAMNEVGLNHGAIASLGSLCSVSFTGSGWWWNMWVHMVTSEEYTLGEAATYSNARISTIYTPPGVSTGADASQQYVLYGDPMVKFVDPGAATPAPLPRKIAYGTHYPDGMSEGIEGNASATVLDVVCCNPVVTASAAVVVSGSGSAVLSIYDVSGRLISTPYAGNLNGISSINVDFSQFASGLYFLNLRQGDNTSTTSMMLVR